MFVLYNILLLLASPVILVILLAKKRCRPGLLQRLGWLSEGLAEECRDGRTIWVHAVSMGEATAVVPLVQQLKARYPQDRIFVSTVTETGKETVLRRLERQARHLYFPLDFPWIVGRVLDAVKPRVFIFVETELWPNFLRAATARGVPTVLVNGRLSTDSLQGYLRLRPFFERVLQTVLLCSMQSDRDVERIIRLGADPSRVVRTGNLKFDQAVRTSPDASNQIRRSDFGLYQHEELFVAGSTHPVEEDVILDCYRRLLEAVPGLVLIVAPRHIERTDALVGAVKARGFAALRRTMLSTAAESSSKGPRVIILDTRGELAALYREATLVFVGGSLVRVGGHNPLEPAACGKAVVFGPHMDHFAEVADMLIRQGGGLQVSNAREMADAMIGLLKDRARLDQMGKAAYELVLANQGAVARNVDLIARILEKRGGELVSPACSRVARPYVVLERLLSAGDRSGLSWILFPLIPLSYLYGLAMRMRSALYARGLLIQHSLPCRVISVGNLTVGGTGKTPVVIALMNALASGGHRVGVISRGYGRRSSADVLEVSDGHAIRGDPAETGDEPFLIAQRCPGMPVAVGADRYRVGRHMLDRFGIKTLVLDDGLQHLALHRDVDILVLDAIAPFGNGYLLPRGRLREPLSALGRASAVLVTRARQAGALDSLKAEIRAVAPSIPIWVTDFVPSALVRVGSEGPSEALGPARLKGERVLAVSGIGNPDSFRWLLVAAGATVADHCVFPDHHAYSREDLQRVKQAAERVGADRIVTTEKDAVKLAGLVSSPSPLEGEGRVRGDIWAVRIELVWIEGREEWARMVLQ